MSRRLPRLALPLAPASVLVVRAGSGGIARQTVLSVLCLAGGLALPVGTRAQVFGDSGQLVRVRQVNQTQLLTGRIVRFDRDSLVLSLQGNGLFAMGRSEVSQAWVRGRVRSTWQGLGIGLLAGAAIGAGVSAVAYKPCVSHGLDFSCLFTPKSRGQAAAYGAIGGGVIGLVLGGVVGSFVQHEGWRSAKVPALSAAPASGGGVGLALRVRR